MTPTVHIMIRKPVAGADAPIAEQIADQLAAIADRVDGGEKLVTTLSTAVLRVVIAKLRQPAPRALMKPPASSKPRQRVKAGRAHP